MSRTRSLLNATIPDEAIQMREVNGAVQPPPETTVPKNDVRDFVTTVSPTIKFTGDNGIVPCRHNHPIAQSAEYTLIEVFSNTSLSEEDERRLSLRPRSMSHHLSVEDVPSRLWLTLEAKWWRALEILGMCFHGWAWPYPASPAFSRGIETDTVPIELYFYLPPGHDEILQGDPLHRFPCVINFHGGGFCLGEATDDKYWARVVMEQVNCIFVSVNYRRAPEHPFPTPVDDCVEAILFLANHAEEFCIDRTNVALSGFSAGGNLAFTSALRFAHRRNINALGEVESRLIASNNCISTKTMDNYNVHTTDDYSTLTTEYHEHHESGNFLTPVPSSSTMSTSDLVHQNSGTPLRIRSIVAWYPLLDWTISRSRKIRDSLNPEKCLSKTFTDLFDFSYIPAPDRQGDHCSPYASPFLATDDMLQRDLPGDIQIWLCEWDMLLREGQLFAERLARLGKRIDSKVIPEVPHGWDKSPNPFRDQPAINVLYNTAAMKLNRVFQGGQELDSLK